MRRKAHGALALDPEDAVGEALGRDSCEGMHDEAREVRTRREGNERVSLPANRHLSVLEVPSKVPEWERGNARISQRCKIYFPVLTG